MDEPQVLGRASAGIGYWEGLETALRYVLERLKAEASGIGEPCCQEPAIKALLAHVEEHGELPIAQDAKEE